MRRRRKYWALLFLTLAVLGLLILATGLPGVAVSKEWGGTALRPDEAQQGSGRLAEALLQRLPSITPSLIRLVFMSTILIVPLAFFFALFSAEVRRALWEDLKRVVPMILWIATALYLLQRLRLNRTLAAEAAATGVLTAPHWITNPTAMVAFLLGVTLLALVVTAAWLVWRRSRPDQLALISQQVQTTIEELQAGRDFRNAICACYFRMCQVLGQQQRVKRGDSMTPREFAAQLAAIGIGSREIQRLTKLFEVARYGNHPFNAAEEREAIACLQAIVGFQTQLEPEPIRRAAIGSD